MMCARHPGVLWISSYLNRRVLVGERGVCIHGELVWDGGMGVVGSTGSAARLGKVGHVERASNKVCIGIGSHGIEQFEGF